MAEVGEPMTESSERVVAYLNEMDRVDALAHPTYADDIHGINDLHVTRSDLRAILSDLAAALKALTESRARYGDSEARAAELEAVIEKVRAEAETWWQSPPDQMAPTRGAGGLFLHLASTPPSVVLADRDREVAARALEEFADTLGVQAGDEESDEWRGYRNGQRQALRMATERAAAIRGSV